MRLSDLVSQTRHVPPHTHDFGFWCGGWLFDFKVDKATNRIDKTNLHSLAVTQSFATLSQARGICATGGAQAYGTNRVYNTAGIRGAFNKSNRHDFFNQVTGGASSSLGNLLIVSSQHAGCANESYYYIVGGDAGLRIVWRKIFLANVLPAATGFTLNNGGGTGGSANSTTKYIICHQDDGTTNPTEKLLIDSGRGAQTMHTLAVGMNFTNTGGDENRTFICGGNDGAANTFRLDVANNETLHTMHVFNTLSFRLRSGGISSNQWISITGHGHDTGSGAQSALQAFYHETNHTINHFHTVTGSGATYYESASSGASH